VYVPASLDKFVIRSHLVRLCMDETHPTQSFVHPEQRTSQVIRLAVIESVPVFPCLCNDILGPNAVQSFKLNR
jgi:hypothetical protein